MGQGARWTLIKKEKQRSLDKLSGKTERNNQIATPIFYKSDNTTQCKS